MLEGSRTQTDVYNVPVYRRPSNLFVRGYKQDSVSLPNKGPVYRKIGRRKLVPYYDRAEIEDGKIAGRGLEIAWLKDPTDLLFAQIQGSARIKFDDGGTVRLNYDAYNGYPYTAVGRILIERGIIPKEEMSMQKIREWMAQTPDGAKELRRQNRSYIFFREVNLSDKEEAVGAQGIPLTAGRSIAVDKSLHVYGTPFFIEGELPIDSERAKTPFHRLMIAQDTGSAIIGPARADLYFGAGADAGRVSGRLRHAMHFVMLVPKGLDPTRARRAAAGARPAALGEDRKAVSANGAREGSGQGYCRTPALRLRSRKVKARLSLCRPIPLPVPRPVIEPVQEPRRPVRIVPITAMKRSSRPPVLEPRPSPRRRALSEEERALWDTVAKQVKPLRKHRVAKVQAARPHRAFTCSARHAACALATSDCRCPGTACSEAGGPAAGAARQARAYKTVARPQRDRGAARSARHDPDARPSRVDRLPAPRPS